MRPICIGRSEHDFGVTGELDVTRLQRTVRQNDAPHFGCIIRGNGNLGDRIHVAIATNEGDAVAGKQHAI